MPVDGIQQWSEAIQIYPTLLLVNETGIVTNMWVGALTPEEEETVLAMVGDPMAADVSSSSGDLFPAAISELELNRLKAGSHVTVIDQRERTEAASGARPDSVNIPIREWASRMPAEFLPTDVLVVDCTYVTSLDCQGAAVTLKNLVGFDNVYRLQPDGKD